jgi:XapX domain-containing protein
MKLILGFLLAFAIGVGCRLARIPSPAPNAIIGGLLVVSMSTGYVLTDKWLDRPSKTVPCLSRLQPLSRHGDKSCN